MYTREDVAQYIRDHAYELAGNGTIFGSVVERIAARNCKYVNTVGRDWEEHPRWGAGETKGCISLTCGRLTVQSFQQKRGLFDHMHLVDGLSDRHFMIPHDDFFAQAKHYPYFRWSATYNKSDKICRENTAFVLQHEISHEEL